MFLTVDSIITTRNLLGQEHSLTSSPPDLPADLDININLAMQVLRSNLFDEVLEMRNALDLRLQCDVSFLCIKFKAILFHVMD
jgi:hypothetical protein